MYQYLYPSEKEFIEKDYFDDLTVFAGYLHILKKDKIQFHISIQAINFLWKFIQSIIFVCQANNLEQVVQWETLAL